MYKPTSLTIKKQKNSQNEKKSGNHYLTATEKQRKDKRLNQK